MPYRSLFLFLFCLLFGFSCASKPKEILSTAKMKDVLVDLHRADGLFESQEISKKVSKKEKEQYYLNILTKHKTTQAQLDSSLVWYNRDPKKLDKIYFHVLKTLERQEKEIKENPIAASAKQRKEEGIKNIAWFRTYLTELSSPSEYDFSPQKYSFDKGCDSLLRRYEIEVFPAVNQPKTGNKISSFWLKKHLRHLYSHEDLKFIYQKVFINEYCDSLLRRYDITLY